MKTLGLAALALISLHALAAPSADPVPAVCITAYDDVRAGQLDAAAAKMAECAAASKPSQKLTLLLLDRVRVLGKLGRQADALAQLEALTDKAHFETGLADELSGPGVWSRDPEKVKARQAAGFNRFDLLLDIAVRHHRAKDYAAAMAWAERAAQHALQRYRPEGEYLPMDRDAGCAIALRGISRFELDSQSGKQSWPDLSRGYIRGCNKLPVAQEIATLPQDTRQRLDELKARFDAYQAEVAQGTEAIRARQRNDKTKSAGESDTGKLAMGWISQIMDREKITEPLFKQRADFLAAETRTLGREPLFEPKKTP